MMEISSVGSVSAALSQASSGDAVALLVLKKALEIQAQNAMQLIQALPQPVTTSVPAAPSADGINTFA
jgi:hypothetical protein